VYVRAPAAAPARLVVQLPGDARLTVDGAATTEAGATRWFLSPPLEPGRTYHYLLRAEVLRDGQKLTETRRVSVRAGQDSEVRLNPSGFHVAGK
jgi:uncharacterized protein (TIGR03000 family)